MDLLQVLLSAKDYKDKDVIEPWYSTIALANAGISFSFPSGPDVYVSSSAFSWRQVVQRFGWYNSEVVISG